MENEIKARLLEKRIDAIVDEKIELLKVVKESTGLAKTDAMEKFLILNDEEETLSFELLEVQSQIYGEQED